MTVTDYPNESYLSEEYNFITTGPITVIMTYFWNTQRVKIPSKDSKTMPKYAMDRKTNSRRRLHVNKVDSLYIKSVGPRLTHKFAKQ